MFGLIMQWVSSEGIELVKSEAGWAAANVAKNPLLLLNLVKACHSMQMASVPPAEAQYIAWNAYGNIRQLSSMTLTQYRNAFFLCVTNLTTLQYAHMPTVPEQARHFAMRLDPDRHQEFMRSLLNRTRQRAIFPVTIQELVDALNTFIPDKVATTARARPMSYAARCFKCDQEGYFARACTVHGIIAEGKTRACPKPSREQRPGRESRAVSPKPRRDGAAAPKSKLKRKPEKQEQQGRVRCHHR